MKKYYVSLDLINKLNSNALINMTGYFYESLNLDSIILDFRVKGDNKQYLLITDKDNKTIENTCWDDEKAVTVKIIMRKIGEHILMEETNGSK